RDHPEINLVLMDIKLPRMSGLEATREIKKLRPELPVIAQTAHAFSSDRQEALKAGCDDFITKPIPKDTLLKVVGKYLR
ncbi:MAG TPA: response regulator, partial [Bacteroidetes bacterium]|nr:response regulator [Bacteroidota bacterium]